MVGGSATPGPGPQATQTQQNAQHSDNDTTTQSQQSQRTSNPEPPPPKHKKSRANILVATLNINGRSHSTASAYNQISKWTNVHRLMRQKQVSILCLQETHLDHHHISDIHQLFGKRLAVHPSINPNNPSASAGVAFVINKERLTQTMHKQPN